MASDRNGIGFIGLPYIRSAKALAISECRLPYEADQFNVKTEEYPLSRRLFAYTPPKVHFAPALSWIDLALSDDGQQVASDTGFVDLRISVDSDANHARRRERVLLGETISPDALRSFLQVTQNARRLSVTFRFRSNSSELDNRALRDIRRLADYLRRSDNRNASVMLFGFADSKGNATQNKVLSEKRAKAVAEALSAEGVSATIHAFGGDVPVACNDTDDGTAKNRRVETWIMSK